MHGRKTPERSWIALPAWALVAPEHPGFVVIPGPYSSEVLGAVADAYNAHVASAASDDVRVGSTSTRVVDFVNRGPMFDPLYVYPPLLDAAARLVGPAFKLSTLNVRTLRPGANVLDIHVDVERDAPDSPLLGLIVVIDEFRPDNGATRFLSGSHRWASFSRDTRLQEHATQLVSACGRAGSLLVFGSTWHGQGINDSGRPCRLLQGAFIPREGRAGTDFVQRKSFETRARLGMVAQHVLAIADAGSSVRLSAQESR